ncbi:MAG: type II 3-dehydroquinate dehydratase, partial [Alistipes sp.]|nr:type II 3-dehydroquinate dehydratase [Alistipes sp.]
LHMLKQTALEEDLEIEHFQSNHEGALVDKIQWAYAIICLHFWDGTQAPSRRFSLCRSLLMHSHWIAYQRRGLASSLIRQSGLMHSICTTRATRSLLNCSSQS